MAKINQSSNNHLKCLTSIPNINIISQMNPACYHASVASKDLLYIINCPLSYKWLFLLDLRNVEFIGKEFDT